MSQCVDEERPCTCSPLVVEKLEGFLETTTVLIDDLKKESINIRSARVRPLYQRRNMEAPQTPEILGVLEVKAIVNSDRVETERGGTEIPPTKDQLIRLTD
ncbi:hypothetical protein NDU88_004597 [Pleurodeles waltl]|uniref:Uncharacterized protein n=1 Tax=Pleurodeles waltl TaxID=8319 RepID=A0AAV7QFR2_PLEWA|nr:hypothetical protein NDU88_004597 [Pleurodeles waltl]